MAYTKQIVCLANSWKPGGYCIAGRELAKDSGFPWIRPVSNPSGGAVSDKDRLCNNGTALALGDIVQISFTQHVPQDHQHENHLYVPNERWTKRQRTITWSLLPKLTQKPESLWTNGYHSSSGINDKVPDNIAKNHDHSLLFIAVENLILYVSDHPWKPNTRRVRAIFTYNEMTYNLQLTDSVAQPEYSKKRDGSYQLTNVFLCISLGGILNGYAYKLAAGLFTQERFP